MKWDGKTALRHIYDETDPQNLQAEIDTYWVQLESAKKSFDYIRANLVGQ